MKGDNKTCLITRCLAVGAVAIVASSGCHGRSSAVREPRLFDLRMIESLGKQIYEQDRYAAAATEILFRDAGTPESLTKEGLTAWVFTATREGRPVVRFVKEDDKGNVRPAYDVVFRNFREGVCERRKQESLSRPELAQYKAKRLVAANLSRREWPMYNVIALPDPERDSLLVYALATTYDPNLVIVGGHYRFTVSRDGERIELKERLFKSPLVLDKRSIPEGSGNCLFATHLNGDTPAETHVFLTLLHVQPLYVATRNGDLWRIEKGKMQRTGHVEITSEGIHARTTVVSTAAGKKSTEAHQGK